MVSDTVFLWLETAMVIGAVVALISACLVARSNKRLGEDTQRRREQRRAEKHAAEANIDALAGRPELPHFGTPADPDHSPMDRLDDH